MSEIDLVRLRSNFEKQQAQTISAADQWDTSVSELIDSSIRQIGLVQTGDRIRELSRIVNEAIDGDTDQATRAAHLIQLRHLSEAMFLLMASAAIPTLGKKYLDRLEAELVRLEEKECDSE